VVNLLSTNDEDMFIEGKSGRLILLETALIPSGRNLTLSSISIENRGLIQFGNGSTLSIGEDLFINEEKIGRLSMNVINSKNHSALLARGLMVIAGELIINMYGETEDVRLPIIQADELYVNILLYLSFCFFQVWRV